MNIIGLTCVYWLCALVQTQQGVSSGTSDTSNSMHSPGNIHERNAESQIDQSFLQQTQANDLQMRTKGILSEWLIEQFNTSKALRQMGAAETFIIHLQAYESYEFRWDLVRTNSKKRDYLMMLNVYTYQRGDDISLNKEPDEDSFVSVEVRSNMHEDFLDMGKVYVSKNIEVHFPIDSRFVKVQNLNKRSVLLEVGMEAELKQLSVIKEGIASNKHFELSAQKLATIYEESKVTDKGRNRMYKWEWGFLEREQRYQDQMLKLTAAELIAILATAVVQMYCIKGLLDHKQII